MQLLLAVCVALASLSRAATPPPPPQAGIALAAYRDGEVLGTEFDGYAQVADEVLIGSATNFRMASVSKQFTALLAAILIDRGKLSTDTPVRRLLPSLPDYTEPVRVHHLIHHLSGLPNYLTGGFCQPRGPPRNNSDVLRWLHTQRRLLFTPGERYEYSNTGYVLLSSVIEAAGGGRFPALMRELVFAPLGMRASLVYDGARTPPIEHRAFGYDVDRTTLDDENQCLPMFGDGGVYTSAVDMARYTHGVATSALLSAAMTRRLFTPVKTNNGSSVDYGFGWRLSVDARGNRYAEHGGAFIGFRTYMLFLPQHQQLFVAEFSNTAATENPGLEAYRFARQFIGANLSIATAPPQPQQLY